MGASGVDKVYDGNSVAAVTLSDNRVAGDTVVLANTSASFANKNAGTGKTVSVAGISASGADAGNYTLSATSLSTTASITPRLLTLSASAADRDYNGSTAATVTLGDNRVAGDVLTVFAGGSFADKNVGANKTVTVGSVSKIGTDAGNYALPSGVLTAQASITPRLVDVFMNATSRVYDGTTAAVTSLSLGDNTVYTDSLTVSSSAGSFANKNVGNGKQVTVNNIVLNGADAGNYQLTRTSATANASITPKLLTVSATGNSRVYNGGTGATVNFGDNRVAGDVLTLASTSATFDNKNVGTAKTVNVAGISASGADAGNYTLAQTSVSTSAAITPRALSIAATAADRVYDGSTASVVALTDNRIEGDQLTVSGSGSFADKNVGVGKLVTVGNFGLTGVDAGNYALSAPTALTHASITPRAVDGLATGINRVYDGGTAAQVTLGLGDSVVAGDSLSITGSASFGDKNVGVNKAVAVSGMALAGQDAGNYSLTSSQTRTRASITPRALTVSASGQDQVYDGGTVATVALADNRVAGDVLSVTNASAAFADKNAAKGKAVTVAGIAVAGTDAGNYALASTSAATSASITPRALLVSAAAQDRVYDGSLAATVTLADNRVAGDVLSLSGSGKFADKNVGKGKIVAVSSITATGADAGNYSVAGTATASASVTPRDLQVSATGIDKVFDAKLDATVKLADNRVAGDSLSLSNAKAAFADLAVGKAKPVTVSGISVGGVDAGNYKLLNVSAVTSADIIADSSDSVPRLPAVDQVLPAATRAESPLSLLAKSKAEPALAITATSGTALAMPDSDGVKVTLVRGAAKTQAGMIAVDVPKQMISKGDNFSFPLPKAVAEVLAVGGASASVTAPDGSPLPGWLKYNGDSKSFDVSAAPAKDLPYELKIEVDGNRWTLVLAQGS